MVYLYTSAGLLMAINLVPMALALSMYSTGVCNTKSGNSSDNK